MWNIFKHVPKPYCEGYLPEEDGHEIYFRQFGRPDGIPVLSFHGGPGGSSRPKYAELFDRKKYRFIQFDQRGCGNSRYTDLLHLNNTAALLHDAERLLEFLGITSPVIVHGVSWGATLALLFAETYPEKVAKIVVSSIFLARRYDTDWVNAESERFYPDLWEEMRKKVHRNDIFPAYRNLLFSRKAEDNLKALNYLGSYEYLLGQLNPQFPQQTELDTAELRSARIAFYYAQNNYFLTENRILKNAGKIRNIPALLLHNRLDFCCPVKQAWDLHKALPNSALKILPERGHATPALHKAVKEMIKGQPC